MLMGMAALENARRAAVLIVDDESMTRRVLVRALGRKANYEILEAADGVEAQEVLRTTKVDIVITDVRMPRLDGLGLLEWARDNCPGPAWLILSGVETFDVAVKALQLGAFDFVTKPLVSMEALETSVRNALTQKRLEAEREQLRRELEASNAALRLHVTELEQAYGLLREQAETIEQDLRRAERIQRALLPRSVPRMSGLSLEALYRPSHIVGGDSYDIQRLDDDHVAVYVADSAGHGVSAAMLSVLLKQRIMPHSGRVPRPPAEVLTALNRDLSPECSASGLFVTAAYVLLDLTQRTALVASAGHPPVLHVRAGGDWTTLERTGPALGLTREAVYDERHVDLRASDRLFIYTDGLACGRPDGGSLDTRLAKALSERQDRSDGMLHGLLDTLAREGSGGYVDDVTMLLVRTDEAPSLLDNGDEPIASVRPEEIGAALTAGTSQGATWVAIAGRGTWTQCAALHDVCTDALGAGRRLVIDLAACTHLDSTFLGTIHHVVCAAGVDSTRVRLVHVRAAVRQLFEELAMNLVISHMAVDDSSPPPSTMRPLAESRGERSREIILHAHELLASLNPSNEQQFDDVVRALRNERQHGQA